MVGLLKAGDDRKTNSTKTRTYSSGYPSGPCLQIERRVLGSGAAMRVHMFCLCCLSMLLGACLTGNSYPGELASTYCVSLFGCLGDETAEALTNYDDVGECVDEETVNNEDSEGYRGFLRGECTFNSEAAQECLEEITEVRSEDACDGSMDVLSWFLDIGIEGDDCRGVYVCD